MFGIPFLTTSLLLKGGCILAIVGAVSFAGYEVVHTIRKDAVKDIVAADTTATAQAQAQGAKLDAAQSAVDEKSAEDDATHQTAEATVATVIKQKVYIHVHDPAPTAPRVVGCVTVGFVRQHDAAALGVDPDALPLAPGETDDTCSAIEPSALAAAIGSNYAAARENARQLNDLIANVNGKVDATTPKQ